MRDAPTSFGLPRLTPVTKAVLILLAAVFLVVAILVKVSPVGAAIYGALALEPARILVGSHLWTLLTYALLHSLSDPWHIVFNAMFLYFFGPDLEEQWGKRKYVLFLLAAVLGGALVIVAVAALGLSAAPVIGASAACEALAIVWGMTYKDREFLLFFFPARGIHMVYLTVGLAVLDSLTSSTTSAAAHIGGILVGFAWVGASQGPVRRWYLQRRLKHLEAEREAVVRAARRKSAAAASEFRVIRGGRDGDDPKRYLN